MMKTTLDRSLHGIGLPQQPAGRPETVRISKFLLSQSGTALPADLGAKNPAPLIPGLDGVASLVVTGLSPSGTRRSNTFDVKDGRLQTRGSTSPLGHVPYQIAVVMDDGTRYSAVVDITPSKIKSSHQGYELIQNLDLKREAPPAPESVEVAPFYLSQSGQALPIDSKRPLVPNNDGFFEKMVVTGLSPSGTRFENSYDIDAAGHLQSRAGTRPLGHVPYEVALVAKDGQRYTAVVDITPSKTGVSHSGYETIGDLVLRRRAGLTEAKSDAPLNGADAGFTQRGELPEPRISTSPAAIYLKSR